MQPDSHKVCMIADMPPPNNNKELQYFIGNMNFLWELPPATAEVCELLRKLTKQELSGFGAEHIKYSMKGQIPHLK